MHHGLQHAPAQLAALPVLDAQSTQPIRALDAQSFAQLHLQHTLAHPPDHVLFPFLHGLEGDNQAQNTFFATSSFPGGAGSRHHGHHHGPQRRITPRVPAYRGLVWVVCEEDLERAGDAVSLRVLRRRPSRTAADSTLEGAVPSSGSEDDDDEYAYGGYSEWDGEGESDDSGMDEELDEEDQDIMLLDALAHGNGSHRHSSLGASPSTSELDLQRSPMSSVSPASPASPPLNILQTPLPPPHPDIITIASSDSFSHSNPHDHTQSPSGSPSSPSTLSDLGLVGLNMDNSGMAITLPDDVELLPGGIGKKDPASYEGVHMHPVAHRPSLLSTPENATKTSSTPSSTSTSALASQSSSDLSVPGDTEVSESRASPAQTQLELHPQLSTQLDAAEQSQLQRQFEAQVQLGQIGGPSARPRAPRRPDTNPAAPPLLTSTFRPKELLRRRRPPVQGGGGASSSVPTNVAGKLNGSSPARPGQTGCKEDEGWEFVPARVPDGISLRNFGIQVPIYATLADIVVYSPYGATPAALSLARRFRAAIRAKRLERMRAAGTLDDSTLADDAVAAASAVNSAKKLRIDTGVPPIGASAPVNASSNSSSDSSATTSGSASPGDSDDKGFLEYNVFVLTATEDEMRATMPHLMMRVCGAGVPGGLMPAAGSSAAPGAGGAALQAAGAEGGAHTDGPDGHLLELGRLEVQEAALREADANKGGLDMGMSMDMDLDGEAGAGAPTAMDTNMDDTETHVEKKREQEIDDLDSIPNTVDFALREREEMRDLTKASEIISLFPEPALPLASSALSHVASALPSSAAPPPQLTATQHRSETDTPVWDPRVGQVYLGNSADVPLAPEVPSQFRHAATVAGACQEQGSDEDEEVRWEWGNLKDATTHLATVKGLRADYGVEEDVPASTTNMQEASKREPPPDDPFNYRATNDPAAGFGYDVCIECHDLAPFPSTAHLRAAEDHLAMLDVMWKERWEKGWALEERRRARRQESAAARPPPPAPPRPPPNANAVIHLPFPSSPSNTAATMVSLMPIVRFLEKWARPVSPPVGKYNDKPGEAKSDAEVESAPAGGSRRWSSVTSLMSAFPSFPGTSSDAPMPPLTVSTHPSRSRAMTSPALAPVHPTPVQARTRPLKILLYSSDGYTESSVPALCLLMAIKGLLLPEAYLELQVAKRRSFFVYQTDLGILRRVEARLREEREREKEREREREKERERERERDRAKAGAYMNALAMGAPATINANGKRTAPHPTRGGFWAGPGTPAAPSLTSPAMTMASSSSSSSSTSLPRASSGMGRPAAKSVSFAHPPQVMPSSHYSQQPNQQPQHQASVAHAPSPLPAGAKGDATGTQSIAIAPMPTPKYSNHASPPTQIQFEFGSLPAEGGAGASGSGSGSRPGGTAVAMGGVVKGRPRASTSPWLPSLFGGDHQSWFNDPRFDGSFPSRVLPFLYLGNLNHASNAYMLHALGITHVVSVGECALVPPPHHMSATAAACHRPGPVAHFVPGKGPGGHGSLWIEEREGRIKVLDIKGVCDDGIDTLEPQLEPICDWIDKARQEGGQVLVHCRVGVSRSATVTIAYVMKHLGLPLVDAYLIVRSRRLSVLIQPNMRLLYNLCGWEIKLAKERANGDERKLRKELARTLTWPYLSKEVHALNEKYLH